MKHEGRDACAFRVVMKKFLATVVAAGALAMSAAAVALPGASDVERAMSQGNWQKADAELARVLQTHPDSAQAHYLYGQVLEREGRPADALGDLEKARALDPQLRFARDPSRFTVIESRVQAEVNRADPGSASASPAAGMTTDVTPAQRLRHTRSRLRRSVGVAPRSACGSALRWCWPASCWWCGGHCAGRA